ncbi:MAG: hypothetical protein M3077_12030 [Candidatus Dormibacteraeota bacterium]|nr:hypothetical protein [Candidatus Dormibacteraeota bacterium]
MCTRYPRRGGCHGGRRWVIATFGDVNWARNLRAAGVAALTVNRRPETVAARELPQAEAAAFFRETLTPYVAGVPMGRWMLGSMLGAREIFDDPDGAAHSRNSVATWCW